MILQRRRNVTLASKGDVIHFDFLMVISNCNQSFLLQPNFVKTVARKG